MPGKSIVKTSGSSEVMAIHQEKVVLSQTKPREEQIEGSCETIEESHSQ